MTRRLKHRVGRRSVDRQRGTARHNGTVVARSNDGGCTWADTFLVPAQPSAAYPFSRDSATVVDLVTALRQVRLAQRPHRSPRRHERRRRADLVDRDRARRASTQGAPPRLAADAEDTHAYVLVHAATGLLPGKAGDLVYASDDAGGTWVAARSRAWLR